ncbi:MAG: hypothetical protein IKZ02_00925 [Alphaproteobacteria bacterium]|nr:hypothetical protein [Alphaproteobacteria bacterium]
MLKKTGNTKKQSKQTVESKKSVDKLVSGSSGGFISAIFKSIFRFRFITIIGFFIGCIIYDIHSEINPLSNILKTVDLYIIGCFMVFVLHFVLWIFTDKATFYNIKGRVLNFLGDVFFLFASTLGTVGSLFLLNTFIL